MRVPIRAYLRLLLPLPAIVLLAACSTPTLRQSVVVETTPDGMPVHASGRLHRDTYTVARGDTLYSIAFRVGQDFRDLARWNGIRAPYTISPGQQLRVTPPVRRVASRSRTVPKPVPVPVRPIRPTPATSSSAAVAAAPTVVRPSSSRSIGDVRWRWPASGALLKGYDATDAIPGLLIAGSSGDPVHAAADGTVVYSGNGLVGYGELIIIKHSDEYLSAYGHNSRRLVHEGEHVRAGQVIAQMGSSGAPRVELEFQIRRNGKPVDPTRFLPRR